MRKFTAYLLASSLFFSASADAITLNEALEAAYLSNPEIMASRANLAAVDEGYNLAKSQGAVTMDIEGFYGASRRKRSTIFSSQTIQEEDVGGELGLNISKPLYQGGRVKALKAQSKAEIEAARQTLRAVQQKVFLETTNAYIDVVFDQEVLKLQKKHENMLAEMERLVTTREEIGVGTETDIWRIKSRASAIEGDITRAETKLSVSETIFKQVTGRQATDLNWGRSISVPQSVEGAMQLARRNNPQLFEALSREDSAAAAINVAKSAFKPTVAVVGNSFITDDSLKDYRDYDLDGVTVGLNFRMPILNGGATKARVNSAKHQLASRKFETALVERSIKSAVEQSWARYKGAQAVRDSIKRRMENAEKTYKNIEIEFELGTRTIFDVVEAEQDFLNSQVEFLQSRRDAEQAAAYLLASMGMTDTIPHVQQVPPSGTAQTTSAAFAALTKTDSPAQLKRSLPIKAVGKDVLPAHKIVPVNKPEVFAAQSQIETNSDLGLRLRTRSVPKTMSVPTLRTPQTATTAPKVATPAAGIARPVLSREQIFASMYQTDAPSSLGRQIKTQSMPRPAKTVYVSQTAHDSPASLGRRIPIRVSPVTPMTVKQPRVIRFNHALD